MIVPKTLMLAAVALATSVVLPRAHAQGSPELPPDVAGLIGRRAGCNEWSQKAFDPEWKSQIEGIMKVMQSLKCDDVADDERALRQKYAGNPKILASLRATWVKVVKRLPVRIAVPPDFGR
jgi:hypothetical protein